VGDAVVADHAPQGLGAVHRPRVPWKIPAPICSPPFGTSPSDSAQNRSRRRPEQVPALAATILFSNPPKTLHVHVLQVRPAQAARGTGRPQLLRLRSAQQHRMFPPSVGSPFNFDTGPGTVEWRKNKTGAPSPSMHDGQGPGPSPGAGQSPLKTALRLARRPPTRRRPVAHDRRARRCRRRSDRGALPLGGRRNQRDWVLDRAARIFLGGYGATAEGLSSLGKDHRSARGCRRLREKFKGGQVARSSGCSD